VLTVTNMYPQPDRPRLGTFVEEEVRSLRRQGLCVDVLFVDGPAATRNYLSGIGALQRQVATSGPYDLVHAHYVFCGLIALVARRLPGGGRAARLPVVVTQHGIETQLGWTAPLSRYVSRRADFTIATSQRVAAALGMHDGARCAVIPCGVDTEVFRPAPQSAARQALGLPAGDPVVLFVGAPRPEKRIPLIQAAFDMLQQQRVRQQLPAARLVLVHDEPRERVALYMNAADVLVLASTAEGSPMVVREALACDLPVVSTDVGDVADLIRGIPGCHLAEASPEDLAGKLLLALIEAREREAASESATIETAARQRVVPESQKAVAARIERVYRQVLDAQAATGLRPGPHAGRSPAPPGVR
jgi:glycosyltransferase involved in cell wall biosynthesis